MKKLAILMILSTVGCVDNHMADCRDVLKANNSKQKIVNIENLGRVVQTKGQVRFLNGTLTTPTTIVFVSDMRDVALDPKGLFFPLEEGEETLFYDVVYSSTCKEKDVVKRWYVLFSNQSVE